MRIFAISVAAIRQLFSLYITVLVRLVMVIALLSQPLPTTAITLLPPLAHAGWQEKCGECHMLYHPGLLPARSWERLMDGMKKHFGRNVGMDAALRADITAFLVANAADRSTSPLSQAISKTLSASDRPTRISTTRWFETTHANIRKVDYFDKCVICHRRSPSGDFAVVH